MKRKFLSLLLAVAMVFAMTPGLAFADDGDGGASSDITQISLSECTPIGEEEDLEAPIYYINIGSASTKIEFVDFADIKGSLDITGLRQTGHMNGTNTIEAPNEFALTYEDFYEGYGESLYEDAITDLDFSNIFGFFVLDNDTWESYIIVVQADKPEEDKTYNFTATLNDEEITEMSFEDNSYTYDDYYYGEQTAGIYTITIPAGTQEVHFAVDNPVLAYNYDDNGNYLAGWVSNYTEGNKEFTAQVDANDDGEIDFIQVQTPYVGNQSTLLYAITFEYSQDSIDAIEEEIQALIDAGDAESIEKAREAYEKLSKAEQNAISPAIIEDIESKEKELLEDAQKDAIPELKQLAEDNKDKVANADKLDIAVLKAINDVRDAASKADVDKVVAAAKETVEKMVAEKEAADKAAAEKADKIKAAQSQKVASFKAKAKKKKKAKISWKKNANVTGYEIYRATKKKGKYKKVKTVAKNGTGKYTNKKLKKGKKYFYKMRTYTTIDGQKYYGKWTSIKKVKGKK